MEFTLLMCLFVCVCVRYRIKSHMSPWVRYPVWQHTFISPSADSRGAVVSYLRKYVHEVLVNRLGGLSLPRKCVVRLSDLPDMTIDVYHGRKTTNNYNYNPRHCIMGSENYWPEMIVTRQYFMSQNHVASLHLNCVHWPYM